MKNKKFYVEYHYLVRFFIALGFCLTSIFVNAQILYRNNIVSQELSDKYSAFIKNRDSLTASAFIESFTYHLMLSSLPLNESRQYITKLERDKFIQFSKTPFDFKIELLKFIFAYNKRDTQEYNQIFNSVKTKLVNDKRYNDLFQFNSLVANFFFNLGDLQRALPYYHENEKLSTQYSYSFNSGASNLMLIKNTNFIGYIFSKDKKLDSALKYYSKSLAIAEQSNNEVWTGILSGNVGGVLVSYNRFEEAISLLKKDTFLSLKYNQVGSAINAYFLLSKIAWMRKDTILLQKYTDTILIVLQSPAVEDLQVKRRLNILYDEYMGKLKALQGNAGEAQMYFIKAIDSIKENNEIVSKENKENINGRYFRENIVLQLGELEENSRKRTVVARSFFFILSLAAIFIFLQYRFTKKLQGKNREIARQSKDLQELNYQKNKLFAIVAHDLRNPLASLQGLLSLSKENLIDTNEFFLYRDSVSKSLKGLNGTLENLLVWANNGMKQGIKANMTTIRAQTIVAEIIDQVTPFLNAKNLHISQNMEFDGNIQADENFLKVILQNLITNAAKFSNEGDEIKFILKADPSVPKRVLFIIQDQGLGMTEEKIKLLKEKGLSKTSTVGTKGEKGSGLGLTICFEFIEAMGGQLHIESTPGIGSTFKFDLGIV